jgi:hypothetical protein
MSFLRVILQFIKTWFLPTPAHDDPRYARAESEELAAPAVAAAPQQSLTAEPEQDFHYHVNDEPSMEEYGVPPGDSDPDYPEAVPMHPVSPPEGADQRSSRSPSAVNPFADE